MKLLTLIIMCLYLSPASLATEIKTRADFSNDGTLDLFGDQLSSFYQEEFLNGTDVSQTFGFDNASIQAHNLQCQQQQQQQMQDGNSLYTFTCGYKKIIYRQQLSLRNGAIVLTSKSTGQSFTFSANRNQKIQEILDTFSQATGTLYLECASYFARTIVTENHNRQEQVQTYIDQDTLNKCIQNGGDQKTCAVVATKHQHQQQQQQQQYQQPQYQQQPQQVSQIELDANPIYWTPSSNDCKIIEIL